MIFVSFGILSLDKEDKQYVYLTELLEESRNIVACNGWLPGILQIRKKLVNSVWLVNIVDLKYTAY